VLHTRVRIASAILNGPAQAPKIEVHIAMYRKNCAHRQVTPPDWPGRRFKGSLFVEGDVRCVMLARAQSLRHWQCFCAGIKDHVLR
jgi:hypothetical protein